jgi:hypothetical protein
LLVKTGMVSCCCCTAVAIMSTLVIPFLSCGIHVTCARQEYWLIVMALLSRARVLFQDLYKIGPSKVAK